MYVSSRVSQQGFLPFWISRKFGIQHSFITQILYDVLCSIISRLPPWFLGQSEPTTPMGSPTHIENGWWRHRILFLFFNFFQWAWARASMTPLAFLSVYYIESTCIYLEQLHKYNNVQQILHEEKVKMCQFSSAKWFLAQQQVCIGFWASTRHRHKA
jgi:hypothetical protein